MGIGGFLGTVVGTAQRRLGLGSKPKVEPGSQVSDVPAESQHDEGSAVEWKQASEYLPGDWALEIFPKDFEGFPPVSIERRRGEAWLVDGVHGRLITPGNLPLTALGVISFNVRGSQHYDAAVQEAAPSPLDRLAVVHEAGNPFDKNAIAICALGDTRPMGYANKANAARIAKRIRAGEQFSAIALRTPGYGRGGFSVVIADSETISYLMRNVS